MDKLKAQLQPIIRHGFWICVGLVLLGSLGVWFWSTGKLSAETEQRTTKLNSDVTTVSTAREELPQHPNQKSHDEMNKLIDARKQEVIEAWTDVYERQQDILVWPNELGQDIIKLFAGKIPVEKEIDYPPADEQKVNSSARNAYARYIKRYVPTLAEYAGAEWTAELERASSGGMGDGMDYGDDYGGGGDDMSLGASSVGIKGVEDGPLVTWSTSSQTKVVSDLFPWLGSRPSTLQVHYSQENLWILRQLLQIVGEVNAGAEQKFQAKIRAIKEIAIGESVDYEAGTIAEPGENDQGGYGMGDMDDEEYMDGMDNYMSGGDGGSVPGLSLGGEAPDPANGRYLDMQGQPLDAATLRAALSSQSPSDAGLAVAKRVPVMMSVQIHQRFIPRLLAVCGSAPLMVEVKQVRILDKDAAAGGGGGYMGGGGGDDETMSMSMTPEEDEFPFDVTAEVYGLIHIYNPPNDEALGVEKVTSDTVIDGSDKPATTAETPETQPTDATPATPEDLPTPDAELPTPDGTEPAEEATPPAATESTPAPPTAMIGIGN